MTGVNRIYLFTYMGHKWTLQYVTSGGFWGGHPASKEAGDGRPMGQSTAVRTQLYYHYFHQEKLRRFVIAKGEVGHSGIPDKLGAESNML